jgi:preprotein translocase subunit SecB
VPEPSSPGRLLEAFLDELQFRRHRDFAFPEQGIVYGVESDTNAELLDDRTRAFVRLAAEIHWTSHEGDTVDGPFAMQITVGGLFAWQYPDRSDEDIVGWLEFNTTHLLWPYLRTYIASITATAGVPPLTIYTITAPNPILGRREEEDEEQPSPFTTAQPPEATPHG